MRFKRLIAVVAALLLVCWEGGAVSDDFGRYRAMVDSAPFIVIDKTALTLTLYGEGGEVLMNCGCAAAAVKGPKTRKGDGKTPEGVFKINQLLNARGLSHDFGDGKGPVVGAYGPWFLRLDVPGFIDIGIHGTHLPESIGTRSTEGCIRLTNENVTALKSLVKVGTNVIILPDEQPVGENF